MNLEALEADIAQAKAEIARLNRKDALDPDVDKSVWLTKKACRNLRLAEARLSVFKNNERAPGWPSREELMQQLFDALPTMQKREHADWLLITLEIRQQHGGACIDDYAHLEPELQNSVWNTLTAVCHVRGVDGQNRKCIGTPYRIPLPPKLKSPNIVLGG